MSQDSFVDVEKIRIALLKEKIENGLDEFRKNPAQQWTPLRLEKPLLETLLRLIDERD